MRRLTTFLIVGALVGAAATPALAQVGRTELRGSVTDETGGALPGVTVFIQNEADGTFREVITGGDGSYFAAQLLPGTFTVTAALPGFTTFQTTGFELRVGQTLPLDIILGVGALEETVTVSGQAPLVDLTSAEVGGTLDSQELTEMPLQNRSAFAAISLLPGIQFLPSASGGNDTIIANGQTAASSNLNVDGGYNSDSTSGGAGGSQVKVAIESVQEFQVVSGQFDAEFGRSSGAVINAVTKRGTNQWSGAGFSYSTNTAMTARNFFNQQQFEDDPSTEKPTNNKYEFGGVFGGPIVQDKAHFFFSLERRITNPARAVIFADRGPGLPDLNWSQAENWEAWNTMYRVDHQVNGSNSWALRLMNETSPETNRYGNRTLTSGHDGWDDEHIWVGSYTSVIGNNVVNTVRITRSYENVGGGSPAWWALDGPGLRNGQMRNLTPGYEMDSFSDGIAPWAGGRIDSQWQYNNTTSWFVPDKMGDHDIKWGGTYHQAFIEDFRESYLGGQFHFNTDRPFDIDDYSTYPERLRIRVGKENGRQFEYPINTWEVFLQDKWTLNERWTVGLGVRWDAEMLNAAATDNPLMVPGTDPRDWNNISPRLSLAYDVTGDGRSVIRAGFGHFYDRTLFSGLDNVLQDPIYNDSFTANFPRGGGGQGGQEDPGPRNGMPIQDPELAGSLRIGVAANGECGPATTRDGLTHCPLVNHDFVQSIYPPGNTSRFNEGIVYVDNYRRKQPLFGQFTVGFEREVLPTLSVGIDYVNISGSQLLNRINYVAPYRDGIDSSDPVTFYDVYADRGGVYNRQDTVFYPSCPQAGADAGQYSSNPAIIREQCAKADPLTGIDPRTGFMIGVWNSRLLSIESTGLSRYDGLNLSMEKRYSDRWGMRLSYALGYSRGDTFEQYGTNGISLNGVQTQVLNELNMAENWQPAEHDRKHVLTLSGRTELAGGITLSPIFRYMSANPFTMYNSQLDLDRNGTNWDPLPQGTYTGTGANAFTVEHNGRQGGARQGDYINLDLRFGWRARPAEGDTLDIYFDLINVFNRPNFFVASWANGDQNSGNFSRYTLLRSGGVPRQANFGIRYGF